MENIDDYQLTTELKNDNSGFSRWGFAKKGGKEYFVKEFLSPVYPLNNVDLSGEQVLRKKNLCEEFEKEKFFSTVS